MPRWTSLALLLAFTGVAGAQVPESAKPRITLEIGEKIRQGVGKLTEADAIQLLPMNYTVEFVGDAPFGLDAEWKITCEEVNRIRLVFENKKLESFSFEASPAVKPTKVTLAMFKQLKRDMSPEEVEKLLGAPSSRSSVTEGKKSRITMTYSEGRVLTVFLKNGKVNGGGIAEFGGK